MRGKNLHEQKLQNKGFMCFRTPLLLVLHHLLFLQPVPHSQATWEEGTWSGNGAKQQHSQRSILSSYMFPLIARTLTMMSSWLTHQVFPEQHPITHEGTKVTMYHNIRQPHLQDFSPLSYLIACRVQRMEELAPQLPLLSAPTYIRSTTVRRRSDSCPKILFIKNWSLPPETLPFSDYTEWESYNSK